MDSDELSRGNLEVGFRPQKSVKAEKEQSPGTQADQPQAGGPEPARGTPDVEAVAQLTRPKEGGPVANPGPAEFQSCSPGWSSAFYEADCFGTDVHNYVKELEGQKAGGAPDTSTPVSAGPPSTTGLGEGVESKQEFFSQVTKGPSLCLPFPAPLSPPAGAPCPPRARLHVSSTFWEREWPFCLVSRAPGHQATVGRRSPRPGEPRQWLWLWQVQLLGRSALQALVPSAASF